MLVDLADVDFHSSPGLDRDPEGLPLICRSFNTNEVTARRKQGLRARNALHEATLLIENGKGDLLGNLFYALASRLGHGYVTMKNQPSLFGRNIPLFHIGIGTGRIDALFRGRLASRKGETDDG